MAKRASLRLGVASSTGLRLFLKGFCPATQLSKGPLHLQIFIDGQVYPPVTVSRPDEEFSFSFTLPAVLKNKDFVEVVLEVDRTVVPPADGRELGLAFGNFALRRL